MADRTHRSALAGVEAMTLPTDNASAIPFKTSPSIRGRSLPAKEGGMHG